MKRRTAFWLYAGILLISLHLCSCSAIRNSAKYNFNDGEYQTSRFSLNKVYVLKIDDDTISVFPVIAYGDSSAVDTKQRVNYTSSQRKFKDGKINHNFYRPSWDVDLITIPLKYRFATNVLPNTLTTNFSGALFFGYRIDEYKLNYKRTPLNTYKQTVKHIGYSAGLFAGAGSALIDDGALTLHNYPFQYEGVLLLTGFAVNMAIDNITIGVGYGMDYLMDKYHSYWIYEGKPCVGFTVGIDLN